MHSDATAASQLQGRVVAITGASSGIGLAIARALVMRPRLLVLDEPTEGIQPSIIKDIGRIIALLRDRGEMAILLVEQYFDFARDLADRFVVMERGEIVQHGDRAALEGNDVRQRLAI